MADEKGLNINTVLRSHASQSRVSRIQRLSIHREIYKANNFYRKNFRQQ